MSTEPAPATLASQGATGTVATFTSPYRRRDDGPPASGTQASGGVTVAHRPGIVYFHEVCALFELIKREPQHDKKLQYLTEFWMRYQSRDVYPVMRLLIPQQDTERTGYGMKESEYGRLVKMIFNLPDHHEDALLLKNWRNIAGGRKMGAPVGDYAAAVYHVLLNRCPTTQESVTIAQVNAKLDELCRADKKDRMLILRWFIHNCSARENMWILKVILKDHKFGLSPDSILKHFHPDAVEYFNVCSDLKQVCERLIDPSVRIKRESIRLFHGLRPMLAEMARPAEMIALLDTRALVAETKYDGDRIMIHKQGDTIKYMTRRTLDVTEMIGKRFDRLALHHIRADSCIVDGEMMVYDPSVERIVPFGQLRTVCGNDDDPRQLLFVAFDLLYVNGRTLLSEPLRVRHAELEKIIQGVPRELEVVEQVPLTRPEHVWAVFDDAVEAGEEGLMIKDLDSAYVMNERRGGWWKLKPEYSSVAADDLDLIVLGGYYGRGRNRGGIVGEFLVGVRDRNGPDGLPSENFFTVGRVGTGYSIEDLRRLQEKLGPHWRPVGAELPAHLGVLKVEKPHVWIQPTNSIVLKVKYGEIVESDRYSSGYALRFPRTSLIHEDKCWRDCLDIEGLIDAFRRRRQRAAVRKREGSPEQRRADGDGEGEGGKKRKAPTRGGQPRVRLLSLYADTDTTGVSVQSELFKGLTFCVLSEPRTGLTKGALETMIRQYGGEKVQGGSDPSLIFLAGERTARVHNQMNGKHDILSVDWLVDSVREGRRLPYYPWYVVQLTAETQKRVALEMDMYGDRYDEDMDEDHPDALRLVLQQVKVDRTVSVEEAFNEFEEDEQYELTTEQDLFRRLVVYVDRFATVGDESTALPLSPLAVTEPLLVMYGARITRTLGLHVTHIVFDPDDLSRCRTIAETMREERRKAREAAQRERPSPATGAAGEAVFHHLVTLDWVHACISGGVLEDELPFHPLAHSARRPGRAPVAAAAAAASASLTL